MNCSRQTTAGRASGMALCGLLAIIGQAALLAQAPPAANGPTVLPQQPIPIFPAGPAHDYQVLGAVKGVVAKLKLIYAGRTDVQFSEASGKLLVVGPQSIHEEVSQWLATEGLLPPPTPSVLKPVVYTEPQTVQTQVWQFKN